MIKVEDLYATLVCNEGTIGLTIDNVCRLYDLRYRINCSLPKLREDEASSHTIEIFHKNKMFCQYRYEAVIHRDDTLKVELITTYPLWRD